MTQGKPGRALWWISMLSWSIGWLYAAINYSVQRDANIAVTALFCMGLGAFTGALWLIVKMWQILCQVRAQSLGVPEVSVVRSQHRKPICWGVTAREIFTAVGITAGIVALAFLWTAFYGIERRGEAPRRINSGVTVVKPRKAHHPKTSAEHLLAAVCLQAGARAATDGHCYAPRQTIPLGVSLLATDEPAETGGTKPLPNP